MYPDIFTDAAVDARVQELLGSEPVRFWPFSYAPQNEQRPYALHQLVYGTPENTLACAPDIDQFGVQVDAYARTVTEARSVAEALRDALENVCHLVAYNGEGWEIDTGLYRVGLTFEYWTKRP
jgi:hypothetical protein